MDPRKPLQRRHKGFDIQCVQALDGTWRCDALRLPSNTLLKSVGASEDEAYEDVRRQIDALPDRA